MDIYDEAFLNLWRRFNEHKVRYILVGGVATNLHGYQRYTGNVDIFVDDTLENRKILCQAYKAYINLDLQSLETIQFIPGWVNFPLTNGIELDIMTSMKSVDANFEKCAALVTEMELNGITIPVLHVNHVIVNKKSAGPKTNSMSSIWKRSKSYATKKNKPAAYDLRRPVVCVKRLQHFISLK